MSILKCSAPTKREIIHRLWSEPSTFLSVILPLVALCSMTLGGFMVYLAISKLLFGYQPYFYSSS